MDMNDQQRIEALREAVWAALNDPDILKQCIPGCESISKLSDTEMEAVSTLKVGPIKATFKGKVVLSEIDPPNGYRISGEGTGGMAGHAKGGAKVTLEADGEATILYYEVKAEVGGKLAQLGSRLIDGTAKKLAGEFFEKFGKVVVAEREAPAAQEPSATEEPSVAEETKAKKNWLGGFFAKSGAALVLAVGLGVPTCCFDGSHHPAGEFLFPICTALR
ncbi:MAG: carbon monoxide dehydrogenase subunit G [Methylovirgula sp.]